MTNGQLLTGEKKMTKPAKEVERFECPICYEYHKTVLEATDCCVNEPDEVNAWECPDCGTEYCYREDAEGYSPVQRGQGIASFRRECRR